MEGWSIATLIFSTSIFLSRKAARTSHLSRLKTILVCILLLNVEWTYAQKEFNVWHFGDSAGLNFNVSPPQSITDGVTSTLEGCASICDANGQLLFYTDGQKVWNRNHTVMPNGSGLMGHWSSTHSAVIVPAPLAPNRYYVFTVTYQGHPEGLRYSVVDMNLDNGLGDVTLQKNVSVVTPICEKIAAIQHANGLDYWIVVESYQTSAFLSFLLTPNGLGLSPVVSPNNHVLDWHLWIGSIKASQDGSKIAACYQYQDQFCFYDFDCYTGKVSNERRFNLHYAYGVEFSRSGRFLYVTSIENNQIQGHGQVFQYDLSFPTPSTIQASKQFIGQSTRGAGALQMGPDGHIYEALYKTDYVGIIYQPDSQGVACQYTPTGINLSGKYSKFGLPTFVNRTLDTPTIQSAGRCVGESVSFTFNLLFTHDSLEWNFGDTASGTYNTSNLSNPIHVYQTPGTYHITLKIFVGSYPFIVHHVIDIRPPLPLDLGPDTLICDWDVLVLDPNIPGAQCSWFNGSTSPTLEINSAGIYWVNVELNGCRASDSIQVQTIDCSVQIKMPNVFTPNGDNFNDRFIPALIENANDLELSIYNRWGNLVFRTDDPYDGWDGNIKGESCSEGTYFWVIRCSDLRGQSRVLNGTVSIIR